MKQILVSLYFVFTVCFSFAQEQQFIPVSDGAFRYVGRIDFSNPEQVRYDWPGVYIQFQFKGTDLAIRMNDTNENFYNLFVDDQLATVFRVNSDTLIQVFSGLKNKEHRIEIYKRTEGNQGTSIFKGIEIDRKAKMLAWKDIPTRKIEFIGNSITCGYGTEGKSKDEKFRPETENNYFSYAPIMARALDADYHIVAHSGMGVIRNYGYKEKVSPNTMPMRYLQLYDEQKEPLWDFAKWKPDVVVINLGTNDFSTQPHPDKPVFKRAYEELILSVKQNYGDVPVFCIVGPMTDEPCYSYVKEMVEDYRKIHPTNQVYFVGIPTYLMVQDKDLGSDSHPNYFGQQKMAAHVLPVISSVMGWSYADDELSN